jgi:hypothetical protein
MRLVARIAAPLSLPPRQQHGVRPMSKPKADRRCISGGAPARTAGCSGGTRLFMAYSMVEAYAAANAL